MKTPLIVSFLLLFGCSAFSQPHTPVVPNKSDELLKKPDSKEMKPEPAETKEVRYFCPKCSYTSPKPGVCPVDQSTLVREGDYICPDCKKPGDKPGDCPKCGIPLKKKEKPSEDGRSIPLKQKNK